jgi:hypothetical protein
MYSGSCRRCCLPYKTIRRHAGDGGGIRLPTWTDSRSCRRGPMEGSKTPGRAYLLPDGFWGFAGDEKTVGAWVTRVLTTQADVAAKLAAHPDAAERHAFLWVTVGSDMGVQLQLEPGGDNSFPVTAPTLPPGVSHVWVAGSQRQGAIAWFPDRGWWRTPWAWPADKPLTLDN